MEFEKDQIQDYSFFQSPKMVKVVTALKTLKSSLSGCAVERYLGVGSWLVPEVPH
uniref:Uncharacterized protein n=2 Tax=Oryza sativa subsp. japonica TaxID=39947 RepID=Q94H37_ORYSJ|nr:hypothetical protein [Oryza sativa Japonica Group]ABF97082.1 hypothetical protein LOC_Os03g35980 [Oryza sativa Japonica Group]